MIRHFSRTALFLLVCLVVSTCGTKKESPYREWRVYGGDWSASRYSELDQINRSNVHQLQVAWVYHTGDKRDDPPSTIECNPIVIDGVMYVTSPSLKVIALNAATGETIWTFDPFEEGEAEGVKDPNEYNPQFPFGHGLSYTTFEYSDLVLDENRSIRTLFTTTTINTKEVSYKPSYVVNQEFNRRVQS